LSIWRSLVISVPVVACVGQIVLEAHVPYSHPQRCCQEALPSCWQHWCLLDRERIKCFLEVMKEDCVRNTGKARRIVQSRARYVRVCGIHMRRKGFTPFPQSTLAAIVTISATAVGINMPQMMKIWGSALQLCQAILYPLLIT